jgi:hypothetical protein
MSPSATSAKASASFLCIALTLSACGETKESTPAETAHTRTEAKRHKNACASSTAYDQMKRVIFDKAREQSSHRTNLDTLEGFSFVRLEKPVVEGWDPTLDVTRCNGRIILDVPPGSEQALGGERRLAADIAYTAQGAADASGLVYVINGAAPIISKLAAFSLSDAIYSPLPAVDNGVPKTKIRSSGELLAEVANQSAASQIRGPGTDERAVEDAGRAPRSSGALASEEPRTMASAPPIGGGAALPGEATVLTFYNALGSGNGEVASAQVIAQKRSTRAYSADAISRFYGRLPDPLRLTSIKPLPGGAYRVTYRYGAPGLRCNGSAIVRLTSGGTRPMIRSIDAANGC